MLLAALFIIAKNIQTNKQKPQENLETTKAPFSGCVIKQTTVNPYCEKLLSNKNGMNSQHKYKPSKYPETQAKYSRWLYTTEIHG